MPIKSKKSKEQILSANQQEATLQQIYQTEKKTQRFTIDLPQLVYDRMKAETEMNGQTMKGFVLGLIRNHFEQQTNREQ